MRMRFVGRDEGLLNMSSKREKQIPHPAKCAGIRDDKSGNTGILRCWPAPASSELTGCRHSRVSGFALVVKFALAVALLGSASAARAQKLQMPPHEKVVLKNGLTVLLLEKHSVPMVSVAGIVKAGGLADPAGQEGLASTTAGLLRKGTKTRTAQQFAGDIDFIGGTFEADAGADYSSFAAEFLSKDTVKGLELVSDAVLHATFPQAEVDKLLAQSVDGVKAAKDSARDVIFEYYQGYLYNGKGYGRPTGGDENSLKKIQRDAIAKFYDTYYTPGNTILAVAGDFNSAEMKKKIEEVFGGWPAKVAPPVKEEATGPMKGKKLLLVNKADATQTYFVIGNVGVSATDPDRVAIEVVNTVFGSRFTSMLNEALRVESGLTYGATSFFSLQKEPGPFAMFSFTRNETTGKAIDLTLEVLKNLHMNGLTAEQLSSAKSYLKGQFPPMIETSGQLARLIVRYEFLGLDDNEVNQFERRIDGVTGEMAKQAIARHFPLENLTFVLVGKSSEIAPMAKKYTEKQDAKEISAPGFWTGAK
ncbi:MAG TPA: pitrilysin family protein [Candidatus Acidoferrales bacterium]|jgi:zinc protease|nr:pitrilysin family protein [Candidatus Acidoferrales bacterium]